METKKVYMQPEMKTVELTMPSALLAGSGASLITPTSGIGASGSSWGEEIED